jgi:hypothetical protein
LRSFSDGWRHLKFLLFFCPRWLFFIPGFLILLTGLLLQLALAIGGGVNLAGVHLSINTSLASAAFIFLGYQLIGSGILVQNAGSSSGNLPSDSSGHRFKGFRIEYGLLIGVLLAAGGVGLFLTVLYRWQLVEFGDLPGELTLRRIIPAVTLITLGAQTVWLSLMIGSLEMFSAKQIQFSHTRPDTESSGAPNGSRTDSCRHGDWPQPKD